MRCLARPRARRRKDEILDDSRAALRDLPTKEVPTATPTPDPGKDDLENLKDIVASNDSGVSFGGPHGDDVRNAMMHKLLDDPTQGGIELFFIEEIGVVDQPLVDAFINSPLGTEMDPRLKTRIKDIKGLTEILVKVRDKNATKAADKKLKVFGINSSEAKSRPGLLGLENRVAMMNAVAKEAIDAAMKANPGKKFLAFVGAAHSNTHVGGIPGISQIFGVPAVEMSKDTGRLAIHAEDKSLRGMPTAKEIKAIEKMAEAAAKESGYDKLTQIQKDQKIKDLMSKARSDTASAKKGWLSKLRNM